MASWGGAAGTIHHYYSSSTTTADDVYGDSGGIRTMLSRLSIESFDADADADEEFSDHKYAKDEIVLLGFSSDSDDAHQGGAAACYSLPATPPHWRYQNEVGYPQQQQLIGIGGKEYASENEAQKIINSNSRRQRRKRRSLLRPDRWIERDAVAAAAASWDHGKEVVAGLGDGGDDDADDEEEEQISTGMGGMEIGGGWSWSNNNSSFSGGDGESSDQSGGGGGRLMRIITKPKGGRRSICMDLEEMKACRDLGFELEHDQHMMPTPTRLSLSAASNFDTATTSSGGDSPISNWRISSPGN